MTNENSVKTLEVSFQKISNVIIQIRSDFIRIKP